MKLIQFLIRALFFIVSWIIMKTEALEFKFIHLFLKPEYSRKGNCQQTGVCCERLGIGVPKKWLKLEWLNRYLIWWHGYRYNFEYIGQYENNLIYRCRYLKDKKCSIYRFRPRLCREYPKQQLWGFPDIHKTCGFSFLKRGKIDKK